MNSQKQEETSTTNAEKKLKLELSSLEAAVCGAAAGTLAATITSPLDRIKTLLMTDSEAYGGSVVACALQIWHDEGWQGLFVQGLVPRVLYIAPVVMIFFVVYELTQQRLEEWWSATTPTTHLQ